MPIDVKHIANLTQNKDALFDYISKEERGKDIKKFYPVDKSKGNNLEENVFLLFLRWLDSLGQTVSLFAKLNSISKVYVTDCQPGLSEVLMEVLQGALSSLQLLFLRHSDFPTALGALLHRTSSSGCWREVQVYSSGLQLGGGNIERVVSQLVLGRLPFQTAPCPLLHQDYPYMAEAISAVNNYNARCSMIPLLKGTAINSVIQIGQIDLEARNVANQTANHLQQWLEYFKEHPGAFGEVGYNVICKLTAQIFNHFGNIDFFKKVKKEETEMAIESLKERLEDLDRMEFVARQEEVARGVVAGNLFDWPSEEFQQLRRSSQKMSLQSAISRLPERPWLKDSVDEWTEALDKKGYKKAIIFVDNSGFDFVLGNMPFIRELLKKSIQVLVCVNESPSFNDIYYPEAVACLAEIAKICPIIKSSMESKRLRVVSSGQLGCLLDLKDLREDVSMEMRTVDLVILHGGGRSLASNNSVVLSCDLLKTCVMKNKSFSRSFHGQPYDGVFQFVPARKPPGLS